MGNSAPGDGGDNSVTVQSNVPDTAGTVTVHYKTTDHPFPITTDGSGSAYLSFSMGRPTVGYTVLVTVDLGGQASCSTSFTPQ
jgi:hypothetical protein